MDLSIFLGKVIGLYLVILGIFYIARRDMLLDLVNDIFRDSANSITGGVLAIVFGLMIVVSHHVWTADWRVLITLFGYLSLIKGLARLFFPHSGEKFARQSISGYGPIIWGLICLLVGGYLAVQTFFLV